MSDQNEITCRVHDQQEANPGEARRSSVREYEDGSRRPAALRESCLRRPTQPVRAATTTVHAPHILYTYHTPERIWDAYLTRGAISSVKESRKFEVY